MVVANRGKLPLMEFNPDGSYVRSFGDGLPFEGPHSVRHDAQDNLWYIDAGTNLVVKFDPEKRIQMVLGRRPEPWTWLDARDRARRSGSRSSSISRPTSPGAPTAASSFPTATATRAWRSSTATACW